MIIIIIIYLMIITRRGLFNEDWKGMDILYKNKLLGGILFLSF